MKENVVKLIDETDEFNHVELNEKAGKLQGVMMRLLKNNVISVLV